MESTALFTSALGLQDPFNVSDIRFEPDLGEIYLDLICDAKRLICPACSGASHPIHDQAQKNWQHLHFFEYKRHLLTTFSGLLTLEKIPDRPIQAIFDKLMVNFSPISGSLRTNRPFFRRSDGFRALKGRNPHAVKLGKPLHVVAGRIIVITKLALAWPIVLRNLPPIYSMPAKTCSTRACDLAIRWLRCIWAYESGLCLWPLLWIWER